MVLECSVLLIDVSLDSEMAYEQEHIANMCVHELSQSANVFIVLQ